MATIEKQDIDLHVRILGWIHIISGAFFLVIGLFVLMLLAGIGFATGDATASSILTAVGLSVGLLMGILALPGLFAGYGLLTRQSWARILSLVVGVLQLVNIPIGTLIGAYTLWVLLQNDAEAYFSSAKECC